MAIFNGGNGNRPLLGGDGTDTLIATARTVRTYTKGMLVTCYRLLYHA